MKFRNTRKGPYVAPKKVPRADDELIFEPDVIRSGEVKELDGDNPSVRAHLLAGYLEPADTEARKASAEWAKG